nr:hypothetical protein [Tanacetum cinerariifolium]
HRAGGPADASCGLADRAVRCRKIHDCRRAEPGVAGARAQDLHSGWRLTAQRPVPGPGQSSWHSLTAFKQLIGFRESLYRLFLPVALGEPVASGELDVLNEALVSTASQRVLISVPTGFVWSWRPFDTLDGMTAGFMGRIAVQASSLLTSPDLARLKLCALPDC